MLSKIEIKWKTKKYRITGTVPKSY